MQFRIITFFAFTILLASNLSIAALIVKGSVNSATYKEIKPGTVFIVVSLNESLTEKTIASDIAAAMVKAGYTPAKEGEEPTIAVLYKYRVGPGKTGVTSTPNMATGHNDVSSYTHYPRFFSITIIDYQEAKKNKKRILYWEGELRSSGGDYEVIDVSKAFSRKLTGYLNKGARNKKFFTINR